MNTLRPRMSARRATAPGLVARRIDDEELRLGKVLEFMQLLWGLDHGLQKTSKRMAAEFGITGPQRLVIRIVGRYPGLSARRIADAMHIHPSTLTGILHRLEERGLIVRRGDPSDGRRALFNLSARGRALDDVRVGTVEGAVRRALTRIGERDLAVAGRVLESITAELGGDKD